MSKTRVFSATVGLAASWLIAHPVVVGQTVLYVDDDGPGAGVWADAFVDLQDALDVAASTSDVVEIWVAAGTYVPDRGTGNQAAAFQLLGGVGVYGGFTGVETALDQRDPDANVTILSGDLAADDEAGGSNSDNSYHVVEAVDVDSSAVLDGFTISGGDANGPTLAQRRGGGMYVLNANPTVQRCIFAGNATSATGGSFGGGGIYLESSDATLTDCTFRDNFSGAGGGMLNNASAPTLVRCLFASNDSFQGGGIKNLGGSPMLVNCVLDGNTVTAYGGGLFSSNGADALINCTVFNNQATGDGGGLYVTGTTNLTVMNSILWSNQDRNDGETSQVFVDSGSAAVGYSCVQGWSGLLGGNGNIGDDPLFADAASTETGLRLLAGSPCIDAGDNNAVPAEVATDFGGDPRFMDDPETPDTGQGAPPIVDMGAFEFQPESGGDDVGSDPPDEPVALVQELIDLLPGLDIPEKLQDQLGQRLLGVVERLEDQNSENDVAAVNKLEAFVNAVEAQRGKQIPEADADALVESVVGVIGAIESPS